MFPPIDAKITLPRFENPSFDAFDQFFLCFAACLAGELEKVKQSIGQNPSFLSQIDGEGQTLFYICAASGQLECMQWLYQQDPSLLKVCRKDGKTPMHAAIEKRDTLTIKWLYAQDSSLINQADHDNLTPLQMAVLNEDAMALEIVLSSIVDTRTRLSPLQLDFFKEIYPSSAKILGPEHALTIKIKFQILSETSACTNRYFHSLAAKIGFAKACDNLLETLKIYWDLQRIYHPSTALTCINLSNIYMELKEYEKALHYRTEAFIIQGQILGWAHFETIKSYDCLLIICNLTENSQKTLDFHQIVVEHNHQNVEFSRINQSYQFIINTYESSKADQKTVEFLKMAIESYKGLAFSLEKGKMYQEALDNFQKALAVSEEIFDLRGFCKTI